MTGASRQREEPERRAAAPSPAALPGCPSGAAAVTEGLERLEGALVDHAIEIARSNGYAPYTTTIRAAWTEAVRSVTVALGRYLSEAGPGPAGPIADLDYRSDPRFAAMRRVARKHRTVGITLELYIGLFKHFRRVYMEALAGLDMPADGRAAVLGHALDFFDGAELSITADWTAVDGTERLRELQARARTQSLLKDRYVAIFESLRHPAFVFGRDRRMIHANKAAIDLFIGGGEAGDSLYRHGRATLTARLERQLDAALDMDAETASAVWIETVAGRLCFDMRRLPLQDAVGNTALGHLLQLYDVTAHRNATEQAQRAERQMSRFLATMSHEIRTPLHSVLGAAELLRRPEGAAGDSYVDVIQSAGQSLLLTLNNVLDYSKLEHGPPVPRPSDAELRPALEAVCGMASLGLGGQKTAVTLELARDLPERLRLDWAMTRQVLTNLLSNAIRHDDGRGVRLRASLRGGRLRLAVSDHGPGLPAAAAQALERPFEQIHARHTPTGGAGLGLAISRFLVGAMAGRMGHATTGTGAEVWCEVAVAPAAEAGPARGAPCRDGGTSGRCLLVDDDPVGAIVTEHQLARLGLVIDRAETLAEARAALAWAEYDALVIDHYLPDGLGGELLSGFGDERGRRRPRVVVLTANAEALKTAEDACAPVHCVLVKPADRAALARALQGCRSGADAEDGPEDATGAVGPGGAGCPDGLAGLSDATVAAMLEAFRSQWSAFRAELAALRDGAGTEAVTELAHRLAGTTAQLGLGDCETLLQELERRCRDGSGDIAELIARLDRPLEAMASWRRLMHDRGAG